MSSSTKDEIRHSIGIAREDCCSDCEKPPDCEECEGCDDYINCVECVECVDSNETTGVQIVPIGGQSIFNNSYICDFRDVRCLPASLKSSILGDIDEVVDTHTQPIGSILKRIDYKELRRLATGLDQYEVRNIHGDHGVKIHLPRYSNPFQMFGRTMVAPMASGNTTVQYYDTSCMDVGTWCSSAPMYTNIQEWWTMVIESRIRMITMLTGFIENHFFKCGYYFPMTPMDPLKIKNTDMCIIKDGPIYCTAIVCLSLHSKYKGIEGLEKRILSYVKIKKNHVMASSGRSSECDSGSDNEDNLVSLELSTSSASSDTCTVEYEIIDTMDNFTHLHHTSWTDHSTVTPSVLLNLVQAYSEEYKSVIDAENDRAFLIARLGSSFDPQPIESLIHCSAGIGRSGTLYTTLRLIREIVMSKASPGKPDELPTINIPLAILNTRRSRAQSVQTSGQLELIYETIELFCLNALKKLD